MAIDETAPIDTPLTLDEIVTLRKRHESLDAEIAEQNKMIRLNLLAGIHVQEIDREVIAAKTQERDATWQRLIHGCNVPPMWYEVTLPIHHRPGYLSFEEADRHLAPQKEEVIPAKPPKPTLWQRITNR